MLSRGRPRWSFPYGDSGWFIQQVAERTGRLLEMFQTALATWRLSVWEPTASQPLRPGLPVPGGDRPVVSQLLRGKPVIPVTCWGPRGGEVCLPHHYLQLHSAAVAKLRVAASFPIYVQAKADLVGRALHPRAPRWLRCPLLFLLGPPSLVREVNDRGCPLAYHADATLRRHTSRVLGVRTAAMVNALSPHLFWARLVARFQMAPPPYLARRLLIGQGPGTALGRISTERRDEPLKKNPFREKTVGRTGWSGSRISCSGSGQMPRSSRCREGTISLASSQSVLRRRGLCGSGTLAKLINGASMKAS